MKTLKIIGGLSLTLLALWGGTWIIDTAPLDAWYKFPTYVTAFCVWLAGWMCMISGLDHGLTTQTTRGGPR